MTQIGEKEHQSQTGRRQPGSMVTGIGLLAVGGWLVAASLGVPVAGVERLWPVFPALLGLALLTQRRAQTHRSNGYLLLGVIIVLASSFLCLFTLEVGSFSLADMAGYWPVFSLIIGAAFLVIYLAEGMERQALLFPAYLFGGFGLLALPFTLGIIAGGVFSQVLRLWPLLVILAALAVFLRVRARKQDDDSEEA